MVRPMIRVAEPILDGNERAYVLDCLDSTWISSRGKYIEQFEALVAQFCGVEHAVATNNGTTALHLALAALGIGPGDEVIVPTLTYIASVNAIQYCGAKPVFVDCVSPTMTMDPTEIERKISAQTRAIVTVPLFGHPVDWSAIGTLAKEYGLYIVEDAAEALGSSFQGRMTGSWGTCATFSFFGNKIITTGEGGMVVTRDEQLAARLRLLRGQAVSPERCYWHNEVGFNYRMTNVAAAIGCGQMERIGEHLQRRQQVARWYFERLNAHREHLGLPDQLPEYHHCYWMYSIVVRTPGVDRNEVMKQMSDDGIETRPIFYPVHWMPPYQEAIGAYPVSEHHSSHGISLPTHGKLTEADVDYVCERLLASIERLSAASTRSRRAA